MPVNDPISADILTAIGLLIRGPGAGFQTSEAEALGRSVCRMISPARGPFLAALRDTAAREQGDAMFVRALDAALASMREDHKDKRNESVEMLRSLRAIVACDPSAALAVIDETIIRLEKQGG